MQWPVVGAQIHGNGDDWSFSIEAVTNKSDSAYNI